MDGECYFCFYACDTEDYCDGCQGFICADCEEVYAEDIIARRHSPTDHIREDDEY